MDEISNTINCVDDESTTLILPPSIRHKKQLLARSSSAMKAYPASGSWLNASRRSFII
jgi:hypothetical protein